MKAWLRDISCDARHDIVNGSGKVRVKHLPTYEHTCDPNFYLPVSIPAGKILYPCPTGIGYPLGIFKRD